MTSDRDEHVLLPIKCMRNGSCDLQSGSIGFLTLTPILLSLALYAVVVGD